MALGYDKNVCLLSYGKEITQAWVDEKDVQGRQIFRDTRGDCVVTREYIDGHVFPAVGGKKNGSHIHGTRITALVI